MTVLSWVRGKERDLKALPADVLRDITICGGSNSLDLEDQVTDDLEEEEAVPTPRTCTACGGRGCKWCTRGYQDAIQQSAWAHFRSRMRKISSTYSLLEKVVRELVDSLEAIGETGLASQGRACLDMWTEASPDTPERREAGMMVSVFQSKAVAALMRARSSKA